MRKPRTRTRAVSNTQGCIFQDCGHGYSAACNMHTPCREGGRERERESGAVIALEASKCRGGAGEGGHERKGVGFSARYSGQGLRWTNWGSCYARLARGEANLAHLHYRNESLPSAVAREGDKQLKIYNTCSHSGSARHGWTRSNLCTSLSFLFLSRYIYIYEFRECFGFGNGEVILFNFSRNDEGFENRINLSD